MAIILGKRKRNERTASNAGTQLSPQPMRDASREDLVQQTFKRAFETTFEPLNIQKSTTKKYLEHSEQIENEFEGDSEWTGISEEDSMVHNVGQTARIALSNNISRSEKQAFMVSVRLGALEGTSTNIRPVIQTSFQCFKTITKTSARYD
jgi:hypothetical protein